MAKKFIVETSARHVHLTAEAFATLFGEGKELTVKKMLSQPGQFASEERVTIVGPKKSLPNVSILGPFRKANQVELSATVLVPSALLLRFGNLAMLLVLVHVRSLVQKAKSKFLKALSLQSVTST